MVKFCQQKSREQARLLLKKGSFLLVYDQNDLRLSVSG